MSAIRDIVSRLSRVEKLARRILGMVYRDPAWATQLAWHVDFDSGNDTADGKTHATALKTWAQLRYRLGDSYKAPVGQYVDIYLYGHNNPHDPVSINGWDCSVPRSDTIYIYPIPPNYALTQVRVHAMTPRVYYTGVMQAVQVANYLTNTPYVITDTNMKGANQTPPVPPPNDQTYWYNQDIDWNGLPRGGNHDQQRIRITGGPRAGAIAWTSPGNLQGAGVFGGGQNGSLRTGNFGISVQFGYTQDYQTVGITAVIPQAGDPYVVEDLQLLYVDRIIAAGNGDVGGSGIAFNGFQMRLVNGGDSQNPSNQPPIAAAGGSIVFVECQFDFTLDMATNAGIGEGGSFTYTLNCSTIDGIFASGPGFNYVDAGVHHLALFASESAIMLIDADAMLETGSIYAARSGEAWISAAQVWDLPGHARKAGVMCQARGTAYFFGNGSLYGTNRLWGVDQTGGGVLYNPGRAYAIATFDGGQFFYNDAVANIKDLMTIDGHVEWFGIGLSWTRGEKALTTDPATGLPSTLRTTSKALFFETYANGGFGGRAIDLDTFGMIGPITSPTQPTA